MNIEVRTTQRHFDMKDLTEVEMRALYVILNRRDDVLKEKLGEQKGEWVDVWGEEEILRAAIKLRDDISEALEEP